MRRLLQLLVLTSLLAGCAVGVIDERIEYWNSETSRNLPPGSTLKQAEDFFSHRGLKLSCCVSGPDNKNAYMAIERNVGRVLWSEYDVAIIVDFTKDEQVQRTRVLRWGVGL